MGGHLGRRRRHAAQIAHAKNIGRRAPEAVLSHYGRRTLLEQTRRRAALEIAAKQTLYVVNRAHEPYYAPLWAGEPATNLVVQPCNRGTAPAILYSLLRIAAVDPAALAVFFPSDHYISDDEKFMAHIRAALDAARHRRDLVVLLGIHPESPEVEYGWIEPSQPISIPGGSRLLGVRRFWEKPNSTVARLLQIRGCLWNSFVMVTSVAGLLEVIERAIPGLCREFTGLQRALGTRKEAERANSLYQSLAESNFSHQVLAACPERLATLRVSGVKWNDLGEPKRVIASLSLAGLQPQWAANLVAQPA
jgi:mannose-1-phosphate guanylyltransferase